MAPKMYIYVNSSTGVQSNAASLVGCTQSQLELLQHSRINASSG